MVEMTCNTPFLACSSPCCPVAQNHSEMIIMHSYVQTVFSYYALLMMLLMTLQIEV